MASALMISFNTATPELAWNHRNPDFLSHDIKSFDIIYQALPYNFHVSLFIRRLSENEIFFSRSRKAEIITTGIRP
jgi:hypothetical protein